MKNYPSAKHTKFQSLFINKNKKPLNNPNKMNQTNINNLHHLSKYRYQIECLKNTTNFLQEMLQIYWLSPNRSSSILETYKTHKKTQLITSISSYHKFLSFSHHPCPLKILYNRFPHNCLLLSLHNQT